MRFITLFISSYLLISNNSKAADDTTIIGNRVAIIAPLFLDSAFNGINYNLPKTSIPKLFLPGLEFYNGVMMAIDSLKKENFDVEVWIFDSEKKGQSISSLTNELKQLNLSLIIASFNSGTIQKAISDFSLLNTVPVISETFPSNNYLSGNPFFAMVNPTWKTHIEAISNYVNRTATGKKIIIVKKTGASEDKILQQFNSAKNQNKIPDFLTMEVNEDFNDTAIIANLDSTKQNVVICGSLNESFGKNLIVALNNAGKNYEIEAIGMPTWNGLNGTMGKVSNNISLTISTPYNFMRSNNRIASLAKNYKAKFNANPGDMVFKGYESMYHFTKLLITKKTDFINNLSSGSYTVFNSFNFQPVKSNETSTLPDYLENKKLYFIKIVNGVLQEIQ